MGNRIDRSEQISHVVKLEAVNVQNGAHQVMFFSGKDFLVIKIGPVLDATI